MKVFFAIDLFRVLLLVFAFAMPAHGQQGLPELEARRDALMEKRYTASLVALRTPSDAQTFLKLRNMAHEFIAEMNRLKPAYQQWYRQLSSEDKKRLLHRSYTKRWLLLMQEIQFDEAIQQRFLTNITLKREYENLQFMCNRAQELDTSN